MEKENQGIEPHSITYWESRQINIGDYENISFGATSIVKFVPINQQQKKVEISESEITHTYPLMNSSEAFDVARLRVRQVLDERERTIRVLAARNQ